MKQSLETAFPQIITNNCLSFIDSKQFFIFEDENKISQIGEEGILEIVNENDLNLGFLKIDGCLLFALDGKKCDCAIFSEKTFCFVEIKDAKKKQRADKKQEAYEQLANTIRIFKNRGVAFEKINLEAIVVMKYSERFPIKNAESLSARTAFANEFNARLLIGNQKEF